MKFTEENLGHLTNGSVRAMAAVAKVVDREGGIEAMNEKYDFSGATQKVVEGLHEEERKMGWRK